MTRKKIINDPVYGFISIPDGILFSLIEHPWFQRLRRIKQLGLTHYVYPGALHTRFHHALGAMHLMRRAIEVLRSKGTAISPAEALAASIAILLHDIGHGPFSHALEHSLVDVHHEELSLLFMQQLNKQFDGQLSLAIAIFKNQYPKKFFCQLVSGQLDMDRMDYLNRDSFYTGVSEGVIGYDRIIEMLAVKDGRLVVEEKGIYSIEKFIIARRLMYWQVYLHKTSLVAEQMLIKALERAKALVRKGEKLQAPEALSKFLYKKTGSNDLGKDSLSLLESFAHLDDHDITVALKQWMGHKDFVLALLSKNIIERHLFKVVLSNTPFSGDLEAEMRQKVESIWQIGPEESRYLVFGGQESNRAYSSLHDEILIAYKNGKVLPLSEASDSANFPTIITKYYLCHPKLLSTAVFKE